MAMKDDSSITSEAYDVMPGDPDSRWVITCDHASNRVPGFVSGGDLGLPQADMDRHIAYDVGALGVTRALAAALGAAAIASRFSRLVIDPNRGLDDPTLIMKLYDGTIIPANHPMGDAQRAERIEKLYQPYHNALAELIARPSDPIMIAIHSFTPRLQGRSPRPWHVGLLSADDRRLSEPLLARLASEPDLCVGDNEPYAGHLPGDSVDQHALRPGRKNVLIELRSDLIETPEDQVQWGARLAAMLGDVVAETAL